MGQHKKVAVFFKFMWKCEKNQLLLWKGGNVPEEPPFPPHPFEVKGCLHTLRETPPIFWPPPALEPKGSKQGQAWETPVTTPCQGRDCDPDKGLKGRGCPHPGTSMPKSLKLLWNPVAQLVAKVTLGWGQGDSKSRNVPVPEVFHSCSDSTSQEKYGFYLGALLKWQTALCSNYYHKYPTAKCLAQYSAFSF